ncbi:PRD domain protein (TIGR03582 family) [Mobilisporobacter senegalensis]|uniref:PRD domain protein (TIGR03582 family) n=1 Tax=Mobilisporobacter senegalensis TaxID=1329262 RepID=A0A3N1Y239_9FIRM|nr:PRD domain-containing protein [Mobilisporobacter senegalensis]ROR31592.1 PRD domain protein (TIGR03582 family) [Mobilisporobacter senegalensis]
MKFLNTLLKNSELDPQIRDEIIQSYQEVKEKLKVSEISMDEDGEFMFSNHILALIKRVKTHSFVEDMEEEDFEQVSKEAFDTAESLVKDLFEKEHIPINKTEVFLVATHIEMAIQKQKEVKDYE